MAKRIKIRYGKVDELCKLFGCKYITIYDALTYRRNSVLARRIRTYVKEHTEYLAEEVDE